MTSLFEMARSSVAQLALGQRLMALDLGTKTIGVATSDISRQIATPRETIARTKFTKDAERLKEIIAKENIGLVVLGLPLNMDGTEGPRVQSTRAFERNLARLVSLPIIYWDERLSTAAVTRAMIDADLSRAKRAQRVDMMAAAYILQSLLDSTR
jgi:putative holliday junction resolvase